MALGADTALPPRVERPAGRGPDPGGRTTRQLLRQGTAAAAVVLILLGALGVWTLARTASVTSLIVDTRSPAYTQSVLLETALVNQETGIRGYGLSGQTQFLGPYTDGLSQEQAAAAQLRSLLAGDAMGIADLDTVLARAAVWQQRIATPIAAAPPGAPIALASRRADEGIADFNAVRTASAIEQQHLQTAREAARSSLRRIVDLGDWVFTAIAIVIVLLAVAVFEGLRRGITTPLGRLSADARRVADGDLEHSIVATGPADLRALAEDVEGMRRRLASELEATDEARRLLDEQAAELRRSNAELEQFAYVASHDLQEPLRKVASFCQLLQRRYGDQLDERADQYIGFAVDGANRMQIMINDLLTFSRVGRVHKNLGPVDLEQLFAGAADELSLALAEAGARLTHDPLPEVYGDATQLAMLLRNLIGNAVKFRDPARTPQIHLSAVRGEAEWCFAVADNGIGIGPEYAERVFVIFQRLHTKEAYPGTGIGLALCKKIVEFHGGVIAIDPDRVPGARITFTLPDAEPPQDETAAAGEAGPAEADSLTGPIAGVDPMTPDTALILGEQHPPSGGESGAYRILLVEDDTGDALIVRELLAESDLRYELRWKQTLADALADLAHQAADCVLLDLNLPDASGAPFVSAVQDAAPAAAVIVLTGLAESHVGARAVANGAQDYLLKGQVDAQLLHRAIRYAVHRKQAERANAELRENRLRAQENARLERGLLPTPLLDTTELAATTRYLPARERALLGGDFLDVVQTADGKVHAIIGDVSGHGPDEAALGVCLRIAWRSLTLAGIVDLALLDLMEKVLVAERPRAEIFATCCTVTLDLAKAQATIFLAGHHEPLLRGADGPGPDEVEPIWAKHGIALGILPGKCAWHATTTDLPRSGALLLYTDGLIEGYSGPGSERLGMSGLIELILGAPDLGTGPLLDHLMTTTRQLNADRHADDLAILHLAWSAAEVPGSAPATADAAAIPARRARSRR